MAGDAPFPEDFVVSQLVVVLLGTCHIIQNGSSDGHNCGFYSKLAIIKIRVAEIEHFLCYTTLRAEALRSS